MAGTRKVVSFFLASPGDLNEERKIAKQVADELNSMFSHKLNVHIDLVGWEETVSSAGRPQEIINRELERCDVFIGMVWKRWGSAPDNESKFQSGFEEEFTIATTGNRQNKKPLISLFFKKIDTPALNDPGEQLQRVINFRKKVISEKTILFKDFETTAEFENLIRKCIVSYVLEHIEVNELQSQATHTPDLDSQSPQNDKIAGSYDFSPITGQSARFIETVLRRTGNAKNRAQLEPFEVARLRLIANGLGQSQNDSVYLGTHDANLIYRNKENCILEALEILNLLHAGVKNSPYENIPLWYWLQHSKKQLYTLNFLTLTIAESNHAVIKSILDLMTLAEITIQTDGILDRKFYVSNWLSNKNTSVKSSALRYLICMGVLDDLSHIEKEIELNSSQTIALAHEAYIAILLRQGVSAAFNALEQLQPSSLSSEIIDIIFSNPGHIATDELFIAAENRNKLVRARAIETLLRRVSLAQEFVESIRQDPEPNVRALAIPALLSQGVNLNESEAKAIIIKDPSKSTNEEDIAWAKYQPSVLALVASGELERRLVRELPLIPDSYIELCRRNSNAKRPEMIANLNDKYLKFYTEHIAFWAESRGESSTAIIEQFDTLKTFITNRFTRLTLNLLTEKSSAKDIAIIRFSLADPAIVPTTDDFIYFNKYGEWDDIPLILNLVDRIKGIGGKTLLTGIETPSEAKVIAVKTILKLGKNRLVDTLKLEYPEHVLKYIISAVKDSEFLKIEGALIFELLQSENSDIRKHCAMKCAKVYPKAKLSSLLDRYNQADQTYYNVVYWLDFGLHSSKEVIKTVCSKTFISLT
ncbi:DUF4062 domain-containing protein [Pseudomonas syringae]|uniref:DUF4062 domain-containing protein n=1 Tax=Pseudomonas syringae TaxID=317 RepID=UPI000E318734|nr:DUF4062 domain-containing protein [Pseudomonas syringae]